MQGEVYTEAGDQHHSSAPSQGAPTQSALPSPWRFRNIAPPPPRFLSRGRTPQLKRKCMALPSVFSGFQAQTESVKTRPKVPQMNQKDESHRQWEGTSRGPSEGETEGHSSVRCNSDQPKPTRAAHRPTCPSQGNSQRLCFILCSKQVV